MKKNLGSQLALYPMPTTVVGAMNAEKPTWTLVAHVGIIGHDHVLVSLASAHFINGCIKQNQRLSINLVDEAMLPDVDVAGSVMPKARLTTTPSDPFCSKCLPMNTSGPAMRQASVCPSKRTDRRIREKRNRICPKAHRN